MTNASKALSGIKERVYKIVSASDGSNKASTCFDIAVVALIVLSVASIILQSFGYMDVHYGAVFAVFETGSVLFFTVEYLLRLWTAPLLRPDSRHPYLAYIFSGMALIDLLSILPFYLPFVGIDLRFLRMVRLVRLTRLFRLFRVAKLARYLKSAQTIRTVLADVKSQLLAALGICSALLLFSAILMYSVENPSQPDNFPNVLAALWWAVCALTTVGYGDVYPYTSVGKLAASVISLIGIGVIAIPTGIISAGFMRVVSEGKEAKTKYYCPYCGEKLE